MAYCGPKGIPFDVWLGVADTWTEHSRQCALAWQDREAQRCDGCGQVRADWLGADGRELRPLPMDVVDRWCPACGLLHEHRDGQDEARSSNPGWRQGFDPA